MELGNKIKSLRLKTGITQDTLAEALGVSYQSVSKWENNVCAPDIAMLPKLSVFFGVTIDELFDLTTQDRLARIENMFEMEQEIPYHTFNETVAFLKDQLEKDCDKGYIYNLLANMYHHRMLSDGEIVECYAKKSIMESPTEKDSHWLLQKASGAAGYDWNITNHHKAIDFYRELITLHPEVGINYLYIMDNLLADRRIDEAKKYLETYRCLEDHKDFLVPVYEGQIALAEGNWKLAEEKNHELETQFPGNFKALFEMANFYARTCQYEKAIDYYEKSFAVEPVPRYIDALEGMAIIHKIQGDYQQAVTCYDRILTVLKEDHNLTEGESVRHAMEEKQRLLACMEK